MRSKSSNNSCKNRRVCHYSPVTDLNPTQKTLFWFFVVKYHGVSFHYLFCVGELNMVIPFTIGGARVVIPGVYDVLRVQSSLPSPVPAGRSILILGEAEEGLPGNLLDLRLNYFTDFNSVRDYYKSGTIVDAARMAFTAQPNPVFGGAIQRLYVWKTNQTTRASKVISSPVGYGSIVAARYGEDGNMIKSQIKGLSEVKPTKTFAYIPSATAQTLKVSVSGAVTEIVLGAPNVVTGAGCAKELATKLAAVSGLSAAAISAKPVVVGVDGTISMVGAQVKITATTGSIGATVAAGDVLVIPEGSQLAGADNQYAGAHVVGSVSTTAILMTQMTRWDADVEVAQALAPASETFADGVAADASSFAPVVVSVEEVTTTGSAASLEIASAGGSVIAALNAVDVAGLVSIINPNDAAVATISAVASGSKLSVAINGTLTGFVPAPVVGDIVQIGRSSAIAGAAKENVGLYVVESASAKALTLVARTGLAPVSVAAVANNVTASDLAKTAGFVSTSILPKKIMSASEAQVWIEAIDTKNNISFPTTKVGGIVYLEVGFSDGVATGCTLSIDAMRTMTIAVAGGSTLSVKLNKYKTLQNLVDFLNTKTGLTAKVPAAIHKNLPTSVLDAVDSVDILGAISAASTNGRIKGDYYNFKKLLDDNFGLIAFQAGVLALKAGLPSPEATAAFLAGSVIGGTSDADVQAGLDQGLKIDVRNVVPLMSRDAVEDIADSMTDSASSYSIDSINAAVKAHVATASTIKVKRYRFGVISVHESFENAKTKCAEMSYERLQMTFEQYRAIDGNGAIQWFLPWMGAMAVATGRSQAALGTSMLRKTFAVSAVKHVGKKSLFDDSLIQDFDPENMGQVEEAIEAGLVVHKAVIGFGVRMESPDLSTRSRVNDPEGWVWERVNVLFTLDEVRTTVDNTLENYIGARQSDVTTSTIQEAVNSVLRPFVASGSLISYKVNSVVKEGTGYRVNLSVLPTEALEFIGVEIVAERSA